MNNESGELYGDDKVSIEILSKIDIFLGHYEDALTNMGARKGVLGEKYNKFSLLLSLVAGVTGYPTKYAKRGFQYWKDKSF